MRMNVDGSEAGGRLPSPLSGRAGVLRPKRVLEQASACEDHRRCRLLEKLSPKGHGLFPDST